MSKPPKYLVDLFCGAGGGAVGYYRAGFSHIIGVDKHPQPSYPFEFIQCDVFDYIHNHLPSLDQVVAFHASPPCQFHSPLKFSTLYGDDYPDYIPSIRSFLQSTGKPYIIENVPTATLRSPVVVCGASIPELRVIRHRHFESNISLVGIDCPRFFWGSINHPPVRSRWNGYNGQPYITVSGGGNSSFEEAKIAMGIDWVRIKKELNEAIPPAYTEHLGKQLINLI